MKELISVIMSVYNEPISMLEEAMKSITNQTYQNIEFVIIVDNPNNYEAIEFLNDNDSRIKLIINEKNIGLAESLNKGIKASTGSIIARMDADDIALSNRLSLEYELLLQNDYDFVSADVVMIDENGNNINDRETGFPKTQKDFYREIKHRNCLFHPTYMFKRELFDSIGGYKNLRAAQDYEFIMNIIAHNSKIGFLNEPVLKYRVRNGSISQANMFRQYFIASYIRDTYNHGMIFSEKYILDSLNNENNDFVVFCDDFKKYIYYSKNKRFFSKLLITVKSKYMRSHVFHIICRKLKL